MAPGVLDPSPDKTRISAAVNLAVLKDPVGIPCLLGAARYDSNSVVRRTAIVGLKYAMGDDQVVLFLTGRLDLEHGEKNETLRSNLVDTVEKITTSSVDYMIRAEVATQLLKSVAGDPAEVVRLRADKALQRMIQSGVITRDMFEPNGTEPDKPKPKPKPPAKLSTMDKVAISAGVFALLGAIGAVVAVKMR
jgi:hypothetical protein